MITEKIKIKRLCKSVVWRITVTFSVFILLMILYLQGSFVKVTVPVIYVITPTYDRPTQIPDLIRLTSTLMHVDNLHWIVIEDAFNQSQQVKDLLINSKIKHTYLSTVREEGVRFRLKGLTQRNKALSWIRQHHNRKEDGAIYFADDDNVYSLQLFNEIRKTKKVSVWPVGFNARNSVFNTPIVEMGKVVGFYAWAHKRKFAVDMAGFALNVKVLFDYPDMVFPRDAIAGYMETAFLEQCCTLDDLEPRADNCTKVLVWHVRTEKPMVGKSIKNIEWNVTKLLNRFNINPGLYKRKKKTVMKFSKNH